MKRTAGQLGIGDRVSWGGVILKVLHVRTLDMGGDEGTVADLIVTLASESDDKAGAQRVLISPVAEVNYLHESLPKQSTMGLATEGWLAGLKAGVRVLDGDRVREIAGVEQDEMLEGWLVLTFVDGTVRHLNVADNPTVIAVV